MARQLYIPSATSPAVNATNNIGTPTTHYASGAQRECREI